MSTDSTGPTPALFDHLLRVYDAMESSSTIVEQPDSTSVKVYTGFLTKLVTNELRLPVPYYTSIVHLLRDTKAARQAKRGGGTAISEWILNKRPTRADYDKWLENKNSARNPQARSKASQQASQLLDLAGRLDTVEEGYDDMIDILKELDDVINEERALIESLENEVRNLRQRVEGDKGA